MKIAAVRLKPRTAWLLFFGIIADTSFSTFPQAEASRWWVIKVRAPGSNPRIPP
jgi:hypothetical protein